MFRVLEIDDDYFDHIEPNAGVPWKNCGLNLPEELLEKIYNRSARRVFPAGCRWLACGLRWSLIVVYTQVNSYTGSR